MSRMWVASRGIRADLTWGSYCQRKHATPRRSIQFDAKQDAEPQEAVLPKRMGTALGAGGGGGGAGHNDEGGAQHNVSPAEGVSGRSGRGSPAQNDMTRVKHTTWGMRHSSLQD